MIHYCIETKINFIDDFCILGSIIDADNIDPYEKLKQSRKYLKTKFNLLRKFCKRTERLKLRTRNIDSFIHIFDNGTYTKYLLNKEGFRMVEKYDFKSNNKVPKLNILRCGTSINGGNVIDIFSLKFVESSELRRFYDNKVEFYNYAVENFNRKYIIKNYSRQRPKLYYSLCRRYYNGVIFINSNNITHEYFKGIDSWGWCDYIVASEKEYFYQSYNKKNGGIKYAYLNKNCKEVPNEFYK